MNKWRQLMLALVAVAACVLIAGVAYAGTTSGRPKAPTLGKVTPTKAKTSSSRPARENTAGDPDNIQQGDQSSADAPGSENESQSESESGVDPEQGQPGEPAQGHEDPPGDVNHQCAGDCQE